MYFTDITTRKRIEKELVEAKKESEFYKNILTKDLNNFYQCALEYMQQIRQSELDEEHKNYIDIVSYELESAVRLSKNISKLEEIKTKQIDLVAVDLNKVIRSTAFSINDTIFNRHGSGELKLLFNYQENSYGVKADTMLDELFSNIFLNAVMHNTHDKKSIEVRIISPKEHPDVYWEIDIIDNGFGITDERKCLINNFHGYGNDFNAKSCLGFSIINALVERYGGRFWIEDRVKGDHKQGSVFKLMLKKTVLPLQQTLYGVGAVV